MAKIVPLLKSCYFWSSCYCSHAWRCIRQCMHAWPCWLEGLARPDAATLSDHGVPSSPRHTLPRHHFLGTLPSPSLPPHPPQNESMRQTSLNYAADNFHRLQDTRAHGVMKSAQNDQKTARPKWGPRSPTRNNRLEQTEQMKLCESCATSAPLAPGTHKSPRAVSEVSVSSEATPGWIQNLSHWEQIHYSHP